jgi:hypothetical protein
LKQEEDEMMALTQKTAATPSERSVLFARDLLAHRTPDWDFLVGWTVEQLSRFGSSSNDANTATRAWCHGLQSASTPQEWTHWAALIQKHCVPSVWESMVKAVDIASTKDCLPAAN